ncbi:uncharacterized protein LOC136037168 [Artemia franciscana]|uniref:uncharacterized protein LOC136037168 n=1 Tax=Artemia franciscana TaxID=6661 RepID=UPI0032DADEF2
METDIVEALYPQELRLVRAEEKGEQLKLSGKMPICLRKALLIAVWYLGNKESMRSIGNLFGISKSSVHSCVYRICELFSALSSKIILWPEKPEDQSALERSFKERAGFPGVVGAIDGCDINIICPPDQLDSYRNRKCGHSMVLQGICSSDKKFLDIFVGYSGSAHDARIYRNSGIFEKADKNRSDIFLSDSYHLLGDSAYLISEFLLTPFKEPVQGSILGYQTSYNQKHSKTRVVIEHAFGSLKARFRKLHLVDTEIAFILYVITAACVLHNICETEGDRLEDNIQANSECDGSSDAPATSIAAANQPQSQRTSRGVAKREAIARAL